MVDFGLFTGAIQLAMIISEMARAAQSNKVSCTAMNHRIQIANEIIKAAFERQKIDPASVVLSEKAFRYYYQLLERMRDFIAEISKRKTFSKLFYALRFRDEFDSLLRDFDSCVLDLNLGIALRTQAQLETDRNALEEDMVVLRDFRKDLQNGLDTLGGQLVGIRQMIATNRPMDDILAAVEIDYRQILDVSPGETRKGRTFPVHKRSWLAQEVAEKPLGFFGSKDMLDMLKSEVAILKKLDRCNYITKFMGVTNRNNQISIIMEWLPNGDLASSLAKGDMDWEQKLFIAADVARGLMFLHEVGIIHKTLRAKNILLTRFNQAKITNFRQSRLESAQTRPMSDPFSFVRWLAPEKMTPKEVRYGAECDIYSFGMLLFEIASNRIPFAGRTDRELPEMIVLKDMYETVPPGTPSEFANIMSACWSHDPRLRPTTSQVLLILRDACSKYENGGQNFGSLASNMEDAAAPLFAVAPPTPLISQAYPISPPITPISPKNGLLTPEVWNNPYVNRQYVEESLEELRKKQQSGQLQSVPQSVSPQSQQMQQQMQQQRQQLQQQLQLQRQQQQQQQQHQQQQYSHLSQHQRQGSKQEFVETHQPVSNSLPRTPRPDYQPVSAGRHPQGPAQSQPASLSIPKNTQPASPVQMHATAAFSSTPPGSAPPLVNRNTRPLGIKPKKISASLEADMKRLSMQNEGVASSTVNSVNSVSPVGFDKSVSHSPTMVIRNINGANGANGGHGHQSDPRSTQNSRTNSNSSTGSGSSHDSDSPREVIRPRSTSLSSSTPPTSSSANSLSQALIYHESQEREKAWRIFKAHSDQGNAEGMYWTGYYLFHGEGGQPKDRPKAFELFRTVTLMELGQDLHRLSANAHFYTAVCYLEGHGVERNHTTGFGHMEMAADSGNAFAQYLVGDAYHKGSAVVQVNPQKRNHYWQLAARQNEQRAVEQCRRHGIPV
ncbi:hypothetical protein KVV02_003466 [Mortierella alpina]|uniref:Protein kinase domain-containing protein n=1 Tax=Mortierella alpina TaxID=64518 RepID=A0A9P8CX54_MORAP|nr:hypothetical protein KVV02_003466 [Mortierella alpina]